MHHPAFAGLRRHTYKTKAGYLRTAINQLFDLTFEASWKDPRYFQDREESNDFPWSWLHEEIYEWIALAEAVRSAQNKFTMVELGAGYGRWLVSGACLARLLRPDLVLTLVAVEAERTHFKWMRQHFLDNDLDPAEHALFEAAITKDSGTVRFVDGEDPGANYGQSVAYADTEGRLSTAIGINDLLRHYDIVDLVDIDIQGHERMVVPAGIEELTKRVRRAYLSVHEPVEVGFELSTAFYMHGWRNVASFPVSSTSETEFGPIYFQDGVQYWVNPQLG